MLNYPLGLYRGDTSRWRFVLWADTAKTTPVDLTGVAVAAEIRSAPGASPVTVLACTVTLPNTIDLVLSAAQSATLPTQAMWDLQLTYASGDVQTIVAGAVHVSGDVTHSQLIAQGVGVRHVC